jgi:hypothetical protein
MSRSAEVGEGRGAARQQAGIDSFLSMGIPQAPRYPSMEGIWEDVSDVYFLGDVCLAGAHRAGRAKQSRASADRSAQLTRT